MFGSDPLDTGGVTGAPQFGDAVTDLALGKILHREHRSAAPEEDAAFGISKEQPCRPARRQQAGSPASGSEGNAEGGISETLNSPNKAMARARRTTAWYIRLGYVSRIPCGSVHHTVTC